jgi:hypothetical protein
MGVEYNHLREECKLRKQEKKGEIRMGRRLELHIQVFAWRVVFTWIFLENKGFLSVEA